MPPSIDIFFSVVFVSSIIGILTAAILFFASENESFPSRILAFFMLSLSFATITGGAFYTDFFLRFPHLTRLGLLPSVCISPLAYLYVRTVLEQEYRFKKYDFLLFIPIVVYAATFIPYYLLPASEKLVFIRRILADRNLITLEPEGLLPLGWGWMFRAGYSFILAILQLKLLLDYRKKILKNPQGLLHNKKIFDWLTYFSALVFSMFLILLLEVVLHISRFFELFRLVSLTLCGFIVFVAIYLFSRPQILYGLTGYLQPKPGENATDSNTDAEEAGQSVQQRPTTLTLEQAKRYRNQLEEFFDREKPFLKAGYKVKQLSDDLDIPFYQLSAFINQEYGINFNELINRYRVKYLEKLVQNNPEYSQYTLEALGKLAGFNSRSTFIAAVKKNTGKTPQEYFGTLFGG